MSNLCWPQTGWQSAPPAPAPADSWLATDARTPCLLVSVPEGWRKQRTHISSGRTFDSSALFFLTPPLFHFTPTFVYVCKNKRRLQHTLFAASSCSLRISDPFSRISFSLISSEELRSRVSSPWRLPEVGPTWPPPPSTLDSGSGSRSTNLHKNT